MARRGTILVTVVAAFLHVLSLPGNAVPEPGVDIAPRGAQTVWPSDGNLTTILDRMQQAGIEWGRFDLCWWSLVESSPGVYNFNPYVSVWGVTWRTDFAIQQMKARGIEPFPILCYGNPMYDGNQGPYSAAGRTAFGNYCYAAASRYVDSVTYWEIWNEPNLEMFWGRAPDPEDYALLTQAAAARIRQANPDAVVAGGVTSGIDLGFLNTAFQHGLLDAVDAITVHPYRIDKPETIDGEIATLRAMIAARTSRSIPVWTGEWGYDTAWTEITPLGQAKMLGRMMVNNLAQDIGLSIWFATHPFTEHSPTDPGWGLLDYSLNPRPSWEAMRVVNQRLPAPVAAVADPVNVLLNPGLVDQRVAVFARGDNRRLTVAVWLARWPVSDGYGGELANVSFDAPPAAEVRVYDGLTGAEVSVDRRAGATRTQLRSLRAWDYPIYIEIDLPGDVGSGLALY